MNQEVNKLITAIGAMAEMCAVLYKQLIDNGFERKDAMELVKHYITATITPRE